MSVYKDIKTDIDNMASGTRGPDRYVVSAMARQIDAYEALNDELVNLKVEINDLNGATAKLMNVQIVLIIVQIILAVIGLAIAFK